MSANGVSVRSWTERVRAAHVTVTALCSAKLLFPGVEPRYARMLYITMVQSTLDYAAHLGPMNDATRAAVDNLDMRFFAAVLGIRVRETHLPAIRLLFNLDERTLRNRIMALAFHGRITQLHQRPNANPAAAAQAAETCKAMATNGVIQSYLQNTNTDPIQMRGTLFKETAQRMSRPCPWSGRNLLPPALQITQHELRKLAVRWHLRSFPINPHMFQRVGLQFILQELKLLSKPVLSQDEWSRLKIALQAAKAGEATALALHPSYCKALV